MSIPESNAAPIGVETTVPVPSEILELKTDGKNGKEFRIQNRRLFLTYATHLNKEAVKEYFKETFSVSGKKFRVEICHETGDEQCPYLHSHLYVDFGRNFQTKDARRFDLNGEALDADGIPVVIHPNIQYIKSAKHEENVLRYMGKEDPECKDLVKDEPNFYDTVMSKESRAQMLRDCAKRPSDVPGLTMLWGMKQQDTMEIPDLPLQWQRRTEQFLMNAPVDNRAIWWYYCRHGRTGKSEFVKYMTMKYPKDVYFMNDFNRLSDSMCVMTNAVQQGWTGKILLIDLPRSFEDRSSIYAALENVKNGLFTSTKYSGGSTWMKATPHVMCFANFMPVFCAMSNDRWRVSELVQDWNPDGSRLGEPRDGEIKRDRCEAIQKEIDTEKMRAEICKRLDKEMEITQIEEEERRKRGLPSLRHFPTSATGVASRYYYNAQ